MKIQLILGLSLTLCVCDVIMAIKGCKNRSNINIFQENAEFEYYYQIAEYYESCNHIQKKSSSNVWQSDMFISLMQDLNANSSIPKNNTSEVINNAITLITLLFKENDCVGNDINDLPITQRVSAIEELSYFL